jgi:hypothetical protein
MTKYQIPSCGSQIVPYGRTDMTKLTAAFHNFVNVPKNSAYVIMKGKARPRTGHEGPDGV